MAASSSAPSASTSATASRPAKSRRLRRGTRTEDYLIALAAGDDDDTSDPNAPPTLADIDSPFQVQEYLTTLVAQDPHNIQRVVDVPRWRRRDGSSGSGSGSSNGSLPTALSGALNDLDDDDEEQTHVAKDIWLYEHLRRLANDLSHPFVLTLQEHCSRETCPEMKAGEWLYLCAAHATANETECCAIDYITHTLDGATALLNSSRYFPSRLTIPQTSLKHFTSIARRLYRIFAHAWYHHREVFDICESETSLYERFLALSHEYDLVSPDLLVIPSQKQQREQEQAQGHDAGRHDEQELGHDPEGEQASPPSSSSDEEEEEDGKDTDRLPAEMTEQTDAAPAEVQAEGTPDQTGATDAETQARSAGDADAQAPAQVDAERDSDKTKDDEPKTDDA